MGTHTAGNMEQGHTNTTQAVLDTSSPHKTLDYNFLVTILIPLILVVVLMVVSSTIVCNLYRKRKERMSVILSPRAPTILASEYEDREILCRRLFSECEDSGHTPDYGQCQAGMVMVGKGRGAVTRQAPPYTDRRGRS